ncbi:MAG TPA: hypothetical protein VND65_18255 [Candidatus Binatia bacterium]|nr:hypothetical protein [Candidatus Binatia bacterium]
MRYRKLDAGGDYTFGFNANDFLVNSPQTVGQAVLTALLLHQGEWFLDVTVGMPWESQVLGYNTKSLYDAAIKAEILGVQGVSSIASYSSALDPIKRHLTVDVTINTIYGTTTISTSFGVAAGGYGISPYGGPTPYGGG